MLILNLSPGANVRNSPESVRWGFALIFNGVGSEALEPVLGLRQQQVQLYERKV